MGDALEFDLRLDLPGFRLALAERLPLEGVTAITGPSGCGKTTLLRALAGLELAAGRITCGATVWQEGRHRLPPRERRIGMVFQEPRLFPHLDVQGNLAYGARRRYAAGLGAIIDALDLGELLPRRVERLSGGETRRVALGRALASGPRVLFLDEPLTGLDARRKADVLPYLARVADRFGVPMLYVSHAEDEVAALADRVLRIADGRHDGWAPPPQRFFVETLEAGAGEVAVSLGPARFTLPGRADGPRRRRIALPERAVLLTRDNPGPSQALATLPGRMQEAGEGWLRLEVAGQGLRLPLPLGSALATEPPAPGATVWVSILAAILVD